jgi:hypothetical protein
MRVQCRAPAQLFLLGKCPQTVPYSGHRQQKRIRSFLTSAPVSATTSRTKRPRQVANSRSLVTGLDYRPPMFPRGALLPRELPEKYPLFLGEGLLPGIDSGRGRQSGHNPGLDGMAKKVDKSSTRPERSEGESLDGDPDSRSRA